MSWPLVGDVLGAVLLLLGSGLALVAAFAVHFFRDLFSRMHAATKPQVLGLVLMTTGLALTLWHPVVSWTLVLVIAFQLITAPISAHMVGRAGYRTGKVQAAALVVDELTEDLTAAERRAAAAGDERGSAGAREPGVRRPPEGEDGEAPGRGAGGIR